MGKTQTGMCSQRRRLDDSSFVIMKEKKWTSSVAKSKALISCAVSSHHKAHLQSQKSLYCVCGSGQISPTVDYILPACEDVC